MHLLHAPAALYKIAGQIIQKLGMRGTGAHAAEIAGRGDDAVSEMIVPDAIHHHARGQWIRRIGEPGGQGTAAAGGIDASGRSDFRIVRIENRKESRLYFVAFRETAAAAQDMG